jgi:glutamine cyclotransferase
MAQLVVEKRELSKANIIKKYKHDPSAFTQGLVYQNDHFFESTGGWGSSEIRKINKHTGKVINFKKLQSKYFGEGITIYDNKIFQVTWKSNKGFVYDINNFKLLDDFNIYGQGWGLTNDGQSLILSDGSEKIYYLNPKNFEIEKTISVSVNGNKLIYINELEFIRGEIWANIWKSNDIITVNPLSGIVTSIFDISKISEQTEIEDVANGIAWDKVNDKIFITGKNWNFIYLLDI